MKLSSPLALCSAALVLLFALTGCEADSPSDSGAWLEDSRGGGNKAEEFVNLCGGTQPATLDSATNQPANAGDACGCDGVYRCLNLNRVVCTAPLVCPDSPPEIETISVVSLGPTSIRLTGVQGDLGGRTLVTRGACAVAATSSFAPLWRVPEAICAAVSGSAPGTFTANVGGLSPSTNYRVQVYLRTTDGFVWGGGELMFQSTILAAPTLSASDGTAVGEVLLSWTPVDGATGYEYRRVGGPWVSVGNVTSAVDLTPVDALLGGTATATDGTLVTDPSTGVTLRVTGNGLIVPFEPTPISYQVRATGGSGVQGATSVADTGFPAVSGFTQNWERSTTSASGPFVPIGGATTSTYLDVFDTSGPGPWYRMATSSAGAVTVYSNVVEGNASDIGNSCTLGSECNSGNCFGGQCAPDNVTLIQAGTFLMGSPPDLSYALPSEVQHSVTLDHDFVLGTTEVTQAEWLDVQGYQIAFNTACGTDCPVDRASWNLALQYLNRLSVRHGLTECYDLSKCSFATGRFECSSIPINTVSGSVYDCDGYRLPTEAEWEFAYRAGTTTPFYFGEIDSTLLTSCDSIPLVAQFAWFCGSDNGSTRPVASLTPNDFGLYDMAGNVGEFVWDIYVEALSGPVTNPEGPADASGLRVVRGGGHDQSPQFGLAARRNTRLGQAVSQRNVGFRIARSILP